ncbi:MAG: hypothetical protein QOE37_192 [Microbacteriaceae bacterium]|jgi:hypothetical protein|nr:hypothetical protein [Microbacteriaceae bacterium]
MSRWEQIFFDADGALPEIGTTLAGALRLHWFLQDREVVVSGNPEDTGLPTTLTGTVERNVYAETAPDELSHISIFDDMPWVLELIVKSGDYHLQQETALLLFRRMASTLGWRSALTSEYGLLVAAQDAVHGYREFPSDTLSDATHADRWR